LRLWLRRKNRDHGALGWKTKPKTGWRLNCVSIQRTYVLKPRLRADGHSQNELCDKQGPIIYYGMLVRNAKKVG
jgi:hypothetical protein